MLENARAGLTQNAKPVRFVDHEPGGMAPLDLDQPREIREVAVHAVEAFDGDQHALVAAARRDEELSSASRSLCGKNAPLGPRQRRSHDDAVMGKGIVDDQILRPEQCADRRHIRRVTADEDDAALLLIMRRERRLEFAVQRTLARDKPAGGARGAVPRDCRIRRSAAPRDGRSGRDNRRTNNCRRSCPRLSWSRPRVPHAGGRTDCSIRRRRRRPVAGRFHACREAS